MKMKLFKILLKSHFFYIFLVFCELTYFLYKKIKLFNIFLKLAQKSVFIRENSKCIKKNQIQIYLHVIKHIILLIINYLIQTYY